MKIIVQHRCIETWFLDNRRVYKRNPQGELFREYCKFYNVEENDPELMEKFNGFALTAHFYESYLREMLKEYNINYSKSRPRDVLSQPYFEELISRANDTDSLNSFSDLISLINEVKYRMVIE